MDLNLASRFSRLEEHVQEPLVATVIASTLWISAPSLSYLSTGGHLRPDLYGHIPTYIERFGVETAAELAEFEIAHVQAIKDLVAKEQIDCDFCLTRTVDVWCTQPTADKAKFAYDKMMERGLSYMNDVHFAMGKHAEGVRKHTDRGCRTCD